jgi:hypothetical protein
METTAPRAPSRARLATAALALSAATVGLASPADALRGTYRLSGTARVDAGPVLSRQVEARADAILSPGGGPRGVRARLLSQGHACELAATVGEGGALAFEAGQRCAFDVRDSDARGHVEARLRSGRGRAEGRKLSLDLTFELSGALSLRTGERIEVMGRTVELPAAWTPELPLSGEARTVAEGARDESRAGQR